MIIISLFNKLAKYKKYQTNNNKNKCNNYSYKLMDNCNIISINNHIILYN